MSVSLTAVDDLREDELAAWDELAADASEPVPFAEPAFVVAAQALRSEPPQSLLRVHSPQGLLLALPVVRRSRWRRVPVPVLDGAPHPYAFLGGPLVRRGAETEAWEQLLRHLARSRAPWCVVPVMPAEGASYDAVRAAVDTTGTPATWVDAHVRATARRRPEHTYLDGRIRGVHLKGLRRLRRLLGEDLGGEVSLHDRTGDPAALEDFLRIEAQGWKGRAGTAMACVEGGGEFLRDLQARWPDRVQLHCLGTGSSATARTVAVQINLLTETTASCFKTAFDERYARRSPGLLLELDVLRAFHDGSDRQVLDSCAVAGNAMAERVFPDTRALATLVLALSPVGRFAARAARTVDAVGETVRARRAERDAVRNSGGQAA